MSRHIPAKPPASEVPVLWPDALAQVANFKADLYWVGEKVSEPPSWLPELPELSQPATEGMPEGNLLGEGDIYRPLYHHHTDGGDWWVEDGVTGKVLGGSLRADRAAAGKRLGFLTALSLILAFLGGSIIISLAVALASGLAVRTAMRGGNAVFYPVLGLFLGSMAIFWVVARLAQALPAALEEAVDRVENRRLSLPGDERWRSVFASFGLLLVLITLFALLTSIGARDASALVTGLLQSALGGWLAWRFLKEGKGYSLKGGGVVELRGEAGGLVLLALRVGLFALAGSGLASVALMALDLPFLPSTMATKGGEVGAILAVLASRPKDGLALVVALVVKLVGGMFLGPWVSLLLAALTVAGMAQESWRTAFRRAWGFPLGLVFGRLLGRALGLFFLGAGGVAVGEILAEQLAATVGWRLTADPAGTSPEAQPEGSAEASED